MNHTTVGPKAPLLAVTGLHVTFAGGEQAVRGLGLTLAPGETLAVVGESGAGKTATALAIMGLLPATADVTGSVRLRGRELLGLAAKDLAAVRGNDIAMVFQDSALTPVHRVGDQIAEAVRAHTRTPRRTAAERAVELLADLGIPDAARVARAYPHQLSGGQLRRAMVAIAVAADPTVILADEPTAALDTVAQTHVLNTLQTARTRTGAALILITHDLTVAANHTDRVLVMHAGHPVELGTTAEILYHPCTHHTTAPPSATHPDRPTAQPAENDDPAGPGQRALRQSTVSGSPVLEIRGLVKHYSQGKGWFPGRAAAAVRAVDGIDLDVRAGETLGLVGESGCGKTTTLREVLRLGVPQAGSITVFGRDTATLSGRERRTLRRDLHIVFQDPLAALDPRMTVGRSLAEPLRARGRRVGRAGVPELLRLVGLDPAYASRRPGELSGGQHQRVCLARALACDPKLLLLDEPFSALDGSAQAGVVALLRDLRTRLGLSYLIAAHDLTTLRRLADRVAVMRLGRIVEIGAAAAVYETPAHPYTRVLLSADPRREVPSCMPPPPTGCRFRASCTAYAALTAADRRRCAGEEPALCLVRPGQAAACHFPLQERGSLR